MPTPASANSWIRTAIRVRPLPFHDVTSAAASSVAWSMFLTAVDHHVAQSWVGAKSPEATLTDVSAGRHTRNATIEAPAPPNTAPRPRTSSGRPRPRLRHIRAVTFARYMLIDTREQRERGSRRPAKTSAYGHLRVMTTPCVGMTLLSAWRRPTFYG